MVECLLRLDRVVLEALRLWIGIRVESWFIDWTAARPETTTTHFVRIGFDCHKTGHVWCTWVGRRRTSGESGDGQIKSPPEKMYRAHLAGEPGTKLSKYPAGL